MSKKTFVQPNAETENAQWNHFKNQSDEKIATNEKKVVDFKAQSVKVNNNLRPSFNQRVFDLEQKNSALKGKMKTYLQDRTEKQEKFMQECNRTLNELGS